MGKKIQIAPGERFGKWTVLGEDSPIRHCTRVRLRCDCGVESVTYATALVTGKTTQCKSCASRRHGMSGTSEHNSWCSMIQRCTDEKSDRFKFYGARGISVCERWMGVGGFEAFLSDMGLKPTPSHTIERVENSKGYEPGNCRWATRHEQSRNQSTNRVIEARGRSMVISDWAIEVGVERRTLAWRLDHGWPVEKALFTPVGGG